MLPNVSRLLLIWMLLSCVGDISFALSTNKTKQKSERILSRKRRYLIFPTGSSYQLVFDSIMTIPGWTYYAVTGVTAALAWGLPDKPTYPDQELMEKYESGSLPLLQHRKDKNVTETNNNGESLVNSTPIIYLNNNHSFYYQNSNFSNYIKNYKNFSPNHQKPNSYYYKNEHSSAPFTKNIQPPYSSKHYDAFTNYMMKNYFKPWIESDAYKSKSTTTQKPATKKTTAQYKPVINKFHTIYSAFGKRSIPNPRASYAEKFYSDHHRSTRHALYKIVEKYLSAKGYNGTACLLKTLCEVGEKRHEHEPGSFLAEIVRAIFSLPAAQLSHSIEKRHIEYDAAHNSKNCAVKYDYCPYSIWNAGFLVDTYNLLPKFKK